MRPLGLRTLPLAEPVPVQGILPPCWTTARSFFGPVAEAVNASFGGTLP